MTTPEEGYLSNPVYFLSMSCHPLTADPDGAQDVKWTLALNPPPLPPEYAPAELVEIDSGGRTFHDKRAAVAHLEYIWSHLKPLCFTIDNIPSDYLDYFCFEDTVLPSYQGWSISAIEPWRYLD